MKFDIEKFKTEKIAVNCRTEKECEEFVKLFDSNGFIYFKDHKQETCFYIYKNTHCYNDTLTLLNIGYTVLLFSDLEISKTIDKSDKKEAVNNPSHYNQYPVEVIDIIESALTPEQFTGFLLGNELKYRLRAGIKTESYDEDMKKAMWYNKKRFDKNNEV